MTSILTSSKNDSYVFCSTLHGLSNAVYRFSMRCVVLEISGGGAEINPPAGSRLAQTPAGARVNVRYSMPHLQPLSVNSIDDSCPMFYVCMCFYSGDMLY